MCIGTWSSIIAKVTYMLAFILEVFLNKVFSNETIIISADVTSEILFLLSTVTSVAAFALHFTGLFIAAKDEQYLKRARIYQIIWLAAAFLSYSSSVYPVSFACASAVRYCFAFLTVRRVLQGISLAANKKGVPALENSSLKMVRPVMILYVINILISIAAAVLLGAMHAVLVSFLLTYVAIPLITICACIIYLGVLNRSLEL